MGEMLLESMLCMASPARFELTAPGLGILCSILLSYGDTANILHGSTGLAKPAQAHWHPGFASCADVCAQAG